MEDKTGLIRRFEETRQALEVLSARMDRLTALTQGQARELALQVAEGIKELRTRG